MLTGGARTLWVGLIRWVAGTPLRAHYHKRLMWKPSLEFEHTPTPARSLVARRRRGRRKLVTSECPLVKVVKLREIDDSAVKRVAVKWVSVC